MTKEAITQLVRELIGIKLNRYNLYIDDADHYKETYNALCSVEDIIDGIQDILKISLEDSNNYRTFDLLINSVYQQLHIA